MRSLPIGLFVMLVLIAMLAWHGTPGASVLADELEEESMPVFRNDDGYAMVIAEYKATTKADFVKENEIEYEVEFEVFFKPPDDLDVLCFQCQMQVKSAEADRGKELLIAKRAKQGKEFAAILPNESFKDRRGKLIELAASELEGTELSRPAYEIEKMQIEVKAVIVEKRETEEVPAIVADRPIDIGHDTEVQVTLMEVDDKGVMTVNMKVRRPPGTRAALVDSIYALDDKGKRVGGGRWMNELELFDKDYDVEIEFPLQGTPTIDKLQVVLATEYELEPIQFEIEGLFQK